MNRRLRTALALCLMLPLAACGGGQKSSQSTTVTQPATNAKSAPLYAGDKAPKPNCGAVQAVWVNTKTHVYHEPGDPYYGRTSNGKYMCPSAAKAEGDRRSRGAMSNGSE
jgi:hypothetical protein